jgi:glycosyltransferase involved in cell wall biosynthesis
MTAVSATFRSEQSDWRETSRAPRLLIVSPVAPVPEGVGGVFLRDLCLMYPADRLAFAILPGIGNGPWPDALAAAPRTTLDVVPERGFNRWGRRVQRSTRVLFDQYVEWRYLPALIGQIVAFAERVRPDLVWVPLAGPTMINVAGLLPRRLGLPMVTTVWDAPDYFLPHYWSIDGASLTRLMVRFGEAVRAAVRCGVASPEMKATYEARYGTPCVSMIHGLPESQWIPPAGRHRVDEPFVIGYAGSLYARREWDALMAALASRQWRVAGRPVIVRVLASGLDVRASGPARIEFLGWHSTTDAVAILAECDVCYVPYWFDDVFRAGVQLSFPNKVSLYLAAGRPIFFHGPRESAPARFLDRWPVGIPCHSLDAEEIVARLEVAATDDAFHEAAAEAIPRALHEELGLDRFRRSFADLLGVDGSVLTDPPSPEAKRAPAADGQPSGRT